MNNVEKSAVPGKFHMTGSGFLLASDKIHLPQLPAVVIQLINHHMVHPYIRGAQKPVVPGHLNTVDVRLEIPLCDAAQALMENFICNFPDGSVLFHTQHRELCIMIACHKQKSVFVIRGQVAPSHPVNGGKIDHFKASVFQDPIGFHAKIRDGKQIFPVMGNGHIRLQGAGS